MAARTRPSRRVHPGAWWLWALGLAAAASRTTNPVLLVLLLAVAGLVVATRRGAEPWAGSYSAFLKLGFAVVAIRLVFETFFGGAVPGRVVLLTIPPVPLPAWAPGLRIGGPVTAEGLLAAAGGALQLATMLACVGAANALANPRRLLRCLPGALYEMGVAVVVALTFAPQLVEDAARVRAARRLRGRPDHGLAALRATAVPVLAGGLERALRLAAAMDSRGYGRPARPGAGATARAGRRLTAAALLAGLVGTCVGVFGMFDAGAPAALGLPTLAGGVGVAVAGVAVGGRRTTRSRYRPDRWGFAEWLVVGCGLAAAAGFWWAASRGVAGLTPPTVPLAFPAVPAVPLLAGLAGAVPAVLAEPGGQVGGGAG